MITFKFEYSGTQSELTYISLKTLKKIGMAKLDGKFYRGVVGNTILKKYRDKQLLTIKPYTPKSHLTEGTKKAAKTFGKASHLASWIRFYLGPVINKFYDGTMIYRFNTEVLHCLNMAKDLETQDFNFTSDSFKGLTGFEFNINSPLKHNLFIQPLVNISGTTLQVTLPEIHIPGDIKFPTDSKLCKFIIRVMMLDLTYGHADACFPQSLDIPYTRRTSTIPSHTFNFEVEPGCLCVTAISLQFFERTFAGDFIINNKTFNPAAILHTTIAEGDANKENKKSWSDMDILKWFDYKKNNA